LVKKKIKTSIANELKQRQNLMNLLVLNLFLLQFYRPQRLSQKKKKQFLQEGKTFELTITIITYDFK